jgi:hypothetical protein
VIGGGVIGGRALDGAGSPVFFSGDDGGAALATVGGRLADQGAGTDE